jgi:hypothetical protein
MVTLDRCVLEKNDDDGFLPLTSELFGTNPLIAGVLLVGKGA